MSMRELTADARGATLATAGRRLCDGGHCELVMKTNRCELLKGGAG